MYRLIALICLFLMVGGGSFFMTAEGAESVRIEEDGGQDESARQLRIYTETLYQGSSDEVRVDAAIGLLLRKDKESREVLVKALSSADNPSAQVAVCRGLIQSRGLGSSIAPGNQFAEPLIKVLSGTDEMLAKLAAEALLIYRFSEIENPLLGLIKDSEREPAVRLHGIYVLQLRTEPQALRILIQLLDDSNPEIQKAAETALQEAFGIPVGTNRQVWSAILDQLRQKSPEDIRRERLLRQEMKLREVQEERDRWQKLYLSSLDREYETQDPATRGKFLLERLNSDLSAIRLWALEKVIRLTGETDPALRERLLALLSDNDRQVRLQTARVLTTMSALNPAEKLLEQFHKESDPKVALALFEALGEACYFAFSPGSGITLPESVHSETLEIALFYLSSEQPSTAKIGAEVIRKLLEPNGIDSYEATIYLTALLERYQQAPMLPDSTFRGDLLMIMARLASQGPHKGSAGHLYRQAFLGGLENKDHPEIRLAGMTGLIGIDKPSALKICKEQGLTADPSPAIREILLDLAGQVGTQEDLEWIASQFMKNGASDSAWQSFRAICQRQSPDVCVAWARKLAEQNAQPDRIRQLWENAEQKAQAENNTTLLNEIWPQLLSIYRDANDYLQILELGKRMRSGSADPRVLQAAHPQLFKAVLNTQQWDQGEIVIREALKTGDLDSSSPLVVMIDEFLRSPEILMEAKQSLVTMLKKTKSNPDHPKWDEKIAFWIQKYLRLPQQENQTNGSSGAQNIEDVEQ